MKKFIIFALLVIILIVPLIGCAEEQKPVNQRLFVGSVNSNIYHYPSCEWAQKISPQNEIWFSSVGDAKAHGYRACKVCKPPN